MTANLDQFAGLVDAQNEGIEIAIFDPAGNPLNWKIKVAGPDSDRAKQVARKIQTARLRKRNNVPLTPEELEGEMLQGLADLTLGWSPVVLFGGDFTYSPENALKLYQTPYLRFVVDQVNAGAGDRAGFLLKSLSGSGTP